MGPYVRFHVLDKLDLLTPWYGGHRGGRLNKRSRKLEASNFS